MPQLRQFLATAGLMSSNTKYRAFCLLEGITAESVVKVGRVMTENVLMNDDFLNSIF